MSDIKIALRADSGSYLARCNNCIPGAAYPDSAFVHVPAAKLMESPWAQWTSLFRSLGRLWFGIGGSGISVRPN